MMGYLSGLLDDLQAIHQLKHKHIKVTTDDIQLFYFFKYEELTAFKLFFWADSLDIPKEDLQSFELSEEIRTITQKLNQLYLEIPSIEIWSKDTIQGTVEQIRYAYEAGYLQKSLAEKMLKQLASCLEDIKTYALNSRKTTNPEHKFQWYANDVLGSICYLIEAESNFISFNRFNTFNYLKTQNHEFCSNINAWMDILIKKSVSFSGNGEKQRNRYLKDAFSEIELLLDELSVIKKI